MPEKNIDQNQKDKDLKLVRTQFPKLKFTVIKDEGHFCYHNYKVGDEFILDDFTHPPKHFCAAIAHAAFPCMHTLTFGGRFPFMENTASICTTCPDGGKMAFRLDSESGSKLRHSGDWAFDSERLELDPTEPPPLAPAHYPDEPLLLCLSPLYSVSEETLVAANGRAASTVPKV